MQTKIALVLLLLLQAAAVFATDSRSGQPSGELRTEYGPWVTRTGEDSFSVLWITDSPGLAWVELEDGRRLYHEYEGRRIFERLHCVTVDGLEAGRDYSYRLGAAPLADDSNPRNPVFHPELLSRKFTTSTFDFGQKKCSFSVFNDMHLDLAKYSTLAEGVDVEDTDFLFLNGDIVSAGNYCVDTLARYNYEPLESMNSLPVFFARGNHEGRGNNPRIVYDVHPTPTGHFYYSFRQGPAAFMVLDAGETGLKRCYAYSGGPAYEKYIRAQMEWAAKAAKDPSFARAPIKICLIHVPVVDIGEEYNLQLWLHRNCLSALNSLGFDLMISGDLHEFQYHEAGSMSNDFPIVVNDNDSRLDVRCEKRYISLSVTGKDGSVTFEKTLRVHRRKF